MGVFGFGGKFRYAPSVPPISGGLLELPLQAGGFRGVDVKILCHPQKSNAPDSHPGSGLSPRLKPGACGRVGFGQS